jgi:hypothetical protein
MSARSWHEEARVGLGSLTKVLAIVAVPLLGALALLTTVYLFVAQPILLTGKLIGCTLLDRVMGPRRARQARLMFEQARDQSDDEAAFLAAALDARIASAEALARAVPQGVGPGWRPLMRVGLIALGCLTAALWLIALWTLGGPLSAALAWAALVVSLKVSALVGAACLLLGLSIGVTAGAEARLTRRAFSLEAERVREVFELAGGLSLAEHETLRGALSDDEALRGALTRSPWGIHRRAHGGDLEEVL